MNIFFVRLTPLNRINHKKIFFRPLYHISQNSFEAAIQFASYWYCCKTLKKDCMESVNPKIRYNNDYYDAIVEQCTFPILRVRDIIFCLDHISVKRISSEGTQHMDSRRTIDGYKRLVFSPHWLTHFRF